MPAQAQTYAMPAPIMPAPNMPTVRTAPRGAPAGRRGSFIDSLRLTKLVRIRLRETGPQSSLAKYFDSSTSALSNGISVPSNTQSRIVMGAG